MADNITLNDPGSGSGGGAIVHTDEVGGVHIQRVKVALGVDGVNDGDVSDTLPMPVSGAVAHDAADSGKPLKLGMKALAHGTNPTEVAADDRSDVYCNLAGVPWVIGGHPNVQTIRTHITGSQTDVALVTTTEKIVVTRASVLVANEGTVDVDVRIGFGGATTPTAGGVILSHPGVAPGSGVVEGTGAGMLGVGAAGEDVRITCTDPTSGSPVVGSIDVLLSYYEIAA